MIVAQVLWLSAAVAVTGILHMIVVKLDLAPRLKRPLDGGRMFRGRPVFGPNKTWRGLMFMVVAAGLVGALQGAAFGGWAARSGVACMEFRLVGGDGPSGYAAGYGVVNLVFGLGYALGELPNSFVKRRLGVTPGKTARGRMGAVMFVVDQADSVVAPLVLGALLFPYGWWIVLTGSLWLTLLHLAINATLYGLRVRKNL